MRRTLSIAITILCFAMVASAGDLVKNGSFESPACGALNTNCLVPSGTPDLIWTVEWAETVGSSPAGSGLRATQKPTARRQLRQDRCR